MNARTKRGILAITASSVLAVISYQMIQSDKAVGVGAALLLVSTGLSGYAGKEIVEGALVEEVC